MTPKDFLDKQLYLSMGAGTSQRIHQDAAALWTRRDRISKIVVAALAVTSLCLSVWSAAVSSPSLTAVSIAISAIGALAAITLNVLPFGDWASQHNALYQRWSDLRADVDALIFDIRGDPTQGQVARLKDLDTKYHRLCSVEPKIADALIERHYGKEKQSRRKVALC